MFIPKSSRQLDCNCDIVKHCAVCGKEYVGKCSQNDSTETCSTKCKNAYASIRRQASYQKMTRICALCGKEFSPVTNTQKYCTDVHYRNCVICGKPFALDLSKNASDWPHTCSAGCANLYRFRAGNPFADEEIRAKARQTYEARTGYDHPMHNPEAVAKMKQTSLERYGETSFTKTNEYVVKTRNTNLARYGVEWASQNAEVRSKIKNSFIQSLGVDNPMKSNVVQQKWRKNYKEKTGYDHPIYNPEVLDKQHATNLDRYGVEHAVASEVVREKSKSTLVSKYGVDNPLKVAAIKEKVFATNLSKYGNISYLGSAENRMKLHEALRKSHGVDWYSQTPEWKSQMMQDSSKLGEWMRFLDDSEHYLDQFEECPTLSQLSEKCGVSDSTISAYVIMNGLQDKIRYTLSKMEDDVVDVLKCIDSSIRIVRHDRAVIKPQELDIYLPDHKIGIECNPTSTHNSSVNVFDCDGEPTPYNYHQKKTESCERNGIFLFHIFGSEWTYNRDIITSMLRNLLGKSSHKIYARECTVAEITSSEARDFLDSNHRQGSARARHKLGLFYNGDLVAVMTFGKMRSSIGTGNEDLENCYELVRFCSKLDTNVVGGAGKLFKAFIKRYNPERIRSFSDRAHTRGTLYEKLGFNEVRRSDPGYVWVDMCTDISYHRYCAQKQNIKQFLHDDTIDLNKTEREIMIEHGFLQVYDSGTITWEWIKH